MTHLTQEQLFGLRRMRDCGVVIAKRGDATRAMYGELIRRNLVEATIWRDAAFVRLRYVDTAERKALAA